MENSNDRKYLLIFSALLIGYQYFGVLIDGTIPYTQIKISSQANISIILILLILFFGIEFVVKWVRQEKKERRIFDLSSSVLIATVAISSVCYVYLKKYGIDWKVICSTIGILIAGGPLVIAVDFIVTITFSIRKPEEMKKRGLRKIPSASKAFLSSLVFLIPLIAVILYCLVRYDDMFPIPTDRYWPVIFLAPTLLLNFDHLINLLKCLGPSKIRKKAINNLRRHNDAMDLHEMHYQYIGIEEFKDHELPLICQVAREGKLVDVQNQLNGGVDPNTQDNRGWYPLMWATAEGHFDIVLLLLDHGADPNVINYLGHAAIMYASNYGYYDIAKVLLEKGAIPNFSKGFSDHPPLSAAAYQGHLEVIKLLVEYDANVFYKNREEKTALDIAMEAGNGDVAKFLRNVMLELDDVPVEDKTNLIKNINWLGNKNN